MSERPSGNQEKAAPERRPLVVPYGEQTDEGLYIEGTKVVKPGDPDYDQWYEHLLYAHEHYGDPMPYADVHDLGDRDDDDEEPQR